MLPFLRILKFFYKLSERDHIPFGFTIDTHNVPRLLNCKSDSSASINWDKMTPYDIFDYKTELELHLETLRPPSISLLCNDLRCKDARHITALSDYYDAIIECINRASQCFCRAHRSGTQKGGVPGWNNYVREHRERSIEAHIEWARAGRLESGPIFEAKKQFHRTYKNAINRIRAEEDNAVKESLALKMIQGSSKIFWKDIKRVSESKSFSNIIDGCDDPRGICDLWKDHYNSIFNCFEQPVRNGVYEPEPFIKITPNELLSALDELNTGKASGPDCVSVENLRFGGPLLFNHLLALFNCFLTHGTLPEKFMLTSISPIVKDNKGDITNKANYRPICISSTVSKLFEFILLARIKPYINISENQFGFREGVGIDTCIYSLKESIIRLDNLGTNSFVCLLDATKAFDRINHDRLFSKLSDRGLPKYLIRVIQFWYSNQSMYVKWGSHQSSLFMCSNGIKQGGVLSPLLFNVYFDELSTRLGEINVGPVIGPSRINHFLYADDLALFAITPRGLQKLIDVCQ